MGEYGTAIEENKKNYDTVLKYIELILINQK